MAFITWSSKLETGVTKVDQQHQKLVAMVNALYEAMKDGSGQDVLGKVLNGLVDYTRTHFATEEALMNQFGYPGLATHKIEHDKLTAQVAELQAQFQAGKTALTLKVANFLKDWLSGHILGMDQQYAPFLKDKGVR